MPWKPEFPGERPTLGYAVLDWMSENLAQPNVLTLKPFWPTAEQAEFILGLYEIDPRTCRRIIRRGVLSRARGWGKSPFLSAIGIAEGLADVVCDGWDADGRPVGMPMSEVMRPWVAVAAASEPQTRAAWTPLLEMLREDAPVFDNYPGLEVLGTQVNLPYGLIQPVTSSTSAVKGMPYTAVIADQTEQWLPSQGGQQFMRVLRSNVTKTGGVLIESPNAYIPGQGSVAETSAKAYFAQREGRAKAEKGLLYDHREAPAGTSLTDRESLLEGLRVAYGCSSADPRGCVLHDPPCVPGWANLDDRILDIWQEDTTEQDARADFLNQITFASDAWLGQFEWTARRDTSKQLERGDVIVLGFDGSRGRAKGKPDATALIGCRVTDGHMFQAGLWEAPDQKELWSDWEPPIPEIEDVIARHFRDYSVAGMYCDPARDWRSHVNSWEARWGGQLAVKSRQNHPMEWWMIGGRAALVESAVEQLESAVRLGDMTHSGDDGLTRHVLNARRRLDHGKLKLDKESSHSINKIDAAVAAVLAWQCRLDAVAQGVGQKRARARVRKIR